MQPLRELQGSIGPIGQVLAGLLVPFLLGFEATSADEISVGFEFGELGRAGDVGDPAWSSRTWLREPDWVSPAVHYKLSQRLKALQLAPAWLRMIARQPPATAWSQDRLSSMAAAASSTGGWPSNAIHVDSLSSVFQRGTPLAAWFPVPREFSTRLRLAGEAIANDYREFYSPRNLGGLSIAFGIGATVANTNLDRQFRDWYGDTSLASSAGFDDLMSQSKLLGEGLYTIPLLAAVGSAAPWVEQWAAGDAITQWGQRSTRTFLVGLPPLWVSQLATGASRPGELGGSSAWRPFNDDNGVSGHSFVGAVPLITAAQMTDNRWLKASLYVASTLPALSRVHDDAHYISQAALGWTLAYSAAAAVNRSKRSQSRVRVFPLATGKVTGCAWEFRF